MITPPWYRDNPVEVLAFNMFAFTETEKQEKINRMIEYLCDSYDPNDVDVQAAAFNFVGLQPMDLTLDEVDYIEREVSQRWCNT